LRHGYQLILLIDHLLKHLQSSKKTIINKNTSNKLIIFKLVTCVYLFILLFQNIFFKELSILFFFSCTFKSCYFFAIFIMNNCRRPLYVKFAYGFFIFSCILLFIIYFLFFFYLYFLL